MGLKWREIFPLPLPLTVEAKALDRLVNDSPVVLFASSTCPHSTNAKDLLVKESIEFRAVDLDLHPTKGKLLSDALRQTTKNETVPQIFVCGKFIGGISELRLLRDWEALEGMIQQCAVKSNTNTDREHSS